MNKFKLAAVASAFALSFNAHADADNYTLQSMTPNSPYVGVTLNYSGPLSPTPRNISAYAGMFNLVNAHEPPNPGLNFKAFCVDIFNTVSIGGTYYMHATDNPFAISPAWTNLTLDRVSYMFDNYESEITGNEAAFQLVLWEIINESDSNPLNLTSGDMKFASITDDTVRDKAQDWLDDVTEFADGHGESNIYNFSFYQPGPDDKFNNPFQTVMTWTPCDGQCGGDENEVPEPAPLALIGLGLLGLGFITRKSQSSNNNFAVMYA